MQLTLMAAVASGALLRKELPAKDGSFYGSKDDACTACKEISRPYSSGGSDAWHQYCTCYSANTAALAVSTVGATDKDDWVWACSVNVATIGPNYKECFPNGGQLYQNAYGDSEAPDSLKGGEELSGAESGPPGESAPPGGLLGPSKLPPQGSIGPTKR
mmetsp:Transcript_9697/g.23105  ORF Transcript_9697/g.23105 Transcript_9697/m.23105 type:complete len:159 (+) Transcript_9697:65-541(+)